MPQICRFFGITIYMYFNDHAPAHFHAEYGKGELIDNMTTLGPRRRVLKATPLHDYHMLLEFDDGSEKTIDLAPYLHGPIFEQVRQDSAAFRDVRIAGGTVAWPNGADIDPDVLYYGLTPAWMEMPERTASQ